MQNLVYEYMDKHHMIQHGNIVVAGVSGGADSVCLLMILNELKKRLGFSLYCVHVHHGIRATAQRDANYVANLCLELAIPCEVVYRNIPEMAKNTGMSEEEAGRNARYEIFSQVLSQKLQQAGLTKECGRIAVAHTANDQAETMLFHLFRGSNLRGLGGIRPVRDRIIRPLLCVQRSDIENFLNKQNITWMEDETNRELTYTRNRIRLQLMPMIRDNISQAAVTNMALAGEKLQDTEDYMAFVTKEAIDRCVTRDTSSLCIDPIAFLALHPVIQKRVLYRCMEIIAEQAKDITSTHVDIFLSVFGMQVGKRVNLIYHMQAVRTYDKVILIREDSQSSLKSDAGVTREENEVLQEILLLPINQAVCDCKKNVWRTELEDWEKNTDILQKKYTKWIDYDKITRCLVIRTRRKGDYLVINDHGERQSIKSFFINNKIPVEQRDSLLMVADGSEIVWIPGYRLNARYKLSQDTRQVLKIYTGGEENE